jgi:cell shape-determining protein MreC
MSLCKYKNIFGAPGTGAHSYRFLNIAIVDVILTIIVALLFSYFFKISTIYSIITLFILGILVHRLFCVETTIDKLLFSNKKWI